MKVAILALGMSEKNDSVCNDVAYNYKFLSKMEVLDEVRVFAEIITSLLSLIYRLKAKTNFIIG